MVVAEKLPILMFILIITINNHPRVTIIAALLPVLSGLY